MTLSQGTAAPLLLQGLLMDPADGYDEATFVSCQKHAENGVIAAQLALARMFSMGRKSDRDPVQAYAWFGIAADQITRTKNALKQDMTASQATAAERQVREWHDKSRLIERSSRPRSTDYASQPAMANSSLVTSEDEKDDSDPILKQKPISEHPTLKNNRQSSYTAD